MMFNHHLHHWLFPTYFHFFHTSLRFLSHIPFVFLPKNTRWEWVWKGKAFGVYSFFQLAAAHFDFWWAQGISNTPRLIFSPWGKSHGMVFNPAFSCSDFPNLSYFPGHYFSHIPFIFPPKKLFFWEAFGFDRFFIFSNFLGEFGWFWQLLTLIFEERRVSPIPLK